MRRRLLILLILVLFTTAVLARTGPPSPQLTAVVETERRFSARASEVGVRDSFLEYFADDVVTFSDAIYVGRQRLLSQPAAPRPPRMILQWEPQRGGIASSGDLAWLTGPASLTDRQGERSTRNFIYFSIWKKQSAGDWKVALDLGVSTPSAIPHAEFTAVWGAEGNRANDKASDAFATLAAAEDELEHTAQAKSEADAICDEGDTDLVVRRDGQGPANDRVSGCKILRRLAVSYHRRGRAVSAANDLAYSWGEYETVSGTPAEKGFYARVWQRNGKHWRVVADVATTKP